MKKIVAIKIKVRGICQNIELSISKLVMNSLTYRNEYEENIVQK